MTIDPMRRRLTVGVGSGPMPAAAKGKGKGDEDPVATLGLEEYFKAAAEGSKRVVAVASRTDELKEKKRAFATKDEIIGYGLGMSKEEQAQSKAWLQSSVGWTCNKGKKPEQANQDCFSILVVEGDFALYGVYDGHGPLGHFVSEYACKTLPQLFLQKIKDGEDPGKAFAVCFSEIQKLIEGKSEAKEFDAEMSGTTCTMAYHCMKSQKLWLSHVGDSRSIMGSAAGDKVDALTIDHKPDLEKERKRIESADPPGRVIFDGFFNHRVFAKTGMYPGLNMSRALGDCVAHRMAGLTAEPDVLEIDLATTDLGGTSDRMLILCTDGVWEFIEDGEAFSVALKATGADGNLGKGISALGKLGYDRWLQDSDNEISDDITGIMVRLSQRAEDEHPAA